MGNECSVGNRNREQYQLMGQFVDNVFGEIQILKNERTKEEIGVKEVQFKNNHSMLLLQNKLQLAQSYSNIPTILKIHKYQRFNSNQARIIFDYYPHNLAKLLIHKKSQLKDYIRRNPKTVTQCEFIRMNNYQQIQNLAPGLRKYINLHFQELEIVRMLDHVIGAVYFLHHFGHYHHAIRPQVILIDQQDKYILPDAQIFQIISNSKIAIKEDTNIYLSPQLFSNYSKTDCQVEKSDIFSVGLIALEMSIMLDINLIYNLQTHQFNQRQLSQYLSIVKTKYSEQFYELLTKMLIVNPDQRINFSQLIDSLNPILSKNINDIQKIYKYQPSDELCQEKKCMMLYKKLSEIQGKIKQLAKLKQDIKIQNQQLNRDEVIQDEQRLVAQLKKIKHVGLSNNDKKQFKGTQLYQIYLNEYKNIKKLRPK